MLSGVTGQSQLSTSAASYPGIFEWDTEKKSSLGDFTVTVIDQDTAVSSMSMTAQYDKTSEVTNMVPLYPSLSANLVQGTPSQIPNQGHSLSLPHQERGQVYYCHQGTLGPLLSGELGPCLQSYSSVSYAGSRTSAQPEMVMLLKEIQPTNTLPPASTSGIYYSVSAQPITETGFQGEYKQQESRMSSEFKKWGQIYSWEVVYRQNLDPGTLITMTFAQCSVFRLYIRTPNAGGRLHTAKVTYATCKRTTIQSFSSVQLCDPMNCSMPGLPVHNQLLEFTQIHAH